MKKLLVLCGILLCSNLYAAPVDNASSAGSTTLHIGVLDVPQVLQSSPQVEAIATKLKKTFKSRQDKIVSLQKQLGDDEAKLKRDAAVMNEKDLKALQDKVLTSQRDLQRLQEDYVHDARAAQKEAMGDIMNKINIIVQKIADDGHFDLILQRDTVAFASNRVDITPQVVKAMKESK